MYRGPRDIRVEDLPLPSIAPDEVLVRVRACGICGSDLHMYRLGLFEDLGRPIEGGRVMGHEVAGDIVAAGAAVTGFRAGDRIAGVSLGGFAEYVAIKLSWRGPHHLPAGVSFEEGATLEPLATSIHAVDLARPGLGDTVVVLGAGIIGLGCLQVLRATRECRVIVVDASPRRLAMAQALGADAVVDLAVHDPVEAVIELTGGARSLERFQARSGNADAVIDCAGAQASPDQGLRMLKQADGRLVLVALFERPPALDFSQVVVKQVTVQGSWTWTGADFGKAIELVVGGHVDRTRLISHQFPLADAPLAFATQERPDGAIKVLLKP
ncbi:MAG: zinc-dependent alcohol dehydrogenase [Candidatus Rokuibacteriota bacterium]